MFLKSSFKRLVTLAALIAALAIGSALAATAQADQPVERSTSYLYTWPPPGVQVPGALSRLSRTDQGITLDIKTSGLDAGAAYTVWWIVFNVPDECAPPGCSGADFGNPLVEASALWATGHVIGGNGKANFAAHLQESKPHGQVLFGPGLTDAKGAEIHLVVRSHGLPIPGLVDEQIHTFAGGCAVNVCEDHQYAVHLP
jgi:hypothetical protein